ncbi:MAG TPA: hypothetical protein VM283_05115 [Armatimonadota bacterium]|nr:hypothetical protein [Armatimonadota bacterium]
MSGRPRAWQVAVWATLMVAGVARAWCLDDSPARVQVSAEPSTISIGDVFKLRLEVVAAAGLKLTLPGKDADLSPAEVRAFATEDEHKDAIIQRVTLVYELQVFVVGESKITPPVITYQDTAGKAVEVRPEPTAVVVKSVLPEDAQDIKDIRGPRPLPLSVWQYLGIALAGLLIAALVLAGLYLLARRRRGGATAGRPSGPLPAHSEALLALDELQERGLVEKGLFKDYYVELSYIARRYIERRFGVEALESTTPMLARRMGRSPNVPQIAGGFVEMLTTADLVKFAKYLPDGESAQMDLHGTRKLVKLTRPAEQPEEEEPAAQAAGDR